ncbi:CehA/McbA family metallohydrolase [Paenibacillus xanthanilyticus]|uniref:CehA/McbA family metallohydrolase n=1 Tax=Paenibacillus xanthanilyticus TaxID=1783531 RepID=A0ABV8K5P9_9BACL
MRIKVRVCSANNEPIACKILLYPVQPFGGEAAETGEKTTIYCDGVTEFERAAGDYAIEAYKGKLYTPVKARVVLAHEDVELEIILRAIVDTKQLGLYAFDAHSHVSRSLSSQAGNLADAAAVMKGEGFHFFFAGSPYDQHTHREDLDERCEEGTSYRERFSRTIASVSDDDFVLDIGNEIVKCRYGHMFMMNYEQKPPFSRYYDRAWDPWLFTKIGEEPAYEIAYPYEALGRERGPNSVAVAAHPTSWWWHKEQFITNIAATLGFEILAGSIDAMVVMGYDRDHVHYQALWYEVLNNGYFMPGVAEMDHTFDTHQTKHLAFKTYAHADEFTIDALCAAVKAGRVLASTGPIVLLRVNDQLSGAVLSYAAGETFRIRVEAFRCCDAPLQRLQLIVNGKVWKEYSLNDDRVVLDDTLTVSCDSYIIAKCYDAAGNVAIANPVYVRNQPFANHGFQSALTVQVTKDGQPADGRFWIGKNTAKSSFSGTLDCRIHPAEDVNIEVDGEIKQVKLFELDDLQAIFRHLYFGAFNRDRRYEAGEVPAGTFELARIRARLSQVELQVCF